ncbi:hypothetical protein GCM10007913_39930 [Devosia yakushimensis]|uniref:Uncharacterized protein n=1 Tax=Devosia yakushimensis TaxID=470028 RepID=A0ABQ5UJB7_9HYPH|nr:hypothetical protein GCM10007913_39930 [Devosia yakushimensis]
MAIGKFHGVMMPMTPIGSRVISTPTPGRTDGSTSPARRSTSEEVENLRGAGHFANAFRQRLALFAREQFTQLGLAGQDFLAGLGEDRMAFENARARPSRKRRLGSSDGLLCFFSCGAGIEADDLGRIGRVDILHPIRAHPFPVDEVLV